eukprot:COSAG06_NODE_1132_length_10582_cov_5.539826_10_plen_170_part_00
MWRGEDTAARHRLTCSCAGRVSLAASFGLDGCVWLPLLYELVLYFHQLLSANLVTIYSRADLGYPWQLAPPPPPNTAGPLSTCTHRHQHPPPKTAPRQRPFRPAGTATSTPRPHRLGRTAPSRRIHRTACRTAKRPFQPLEDLASTAPIAPVPAGAGFCHPLSSSSDSD